MHQVTEYASPKTGEYPQFSKLRMFAGLNTLTRIMRNGLFGGKQIIICPAHNEWLCTVVLCTVATVWFSLQVSGFYVKKNVSTWLTVLSAPCFHARLELFSPSPMLKLDEKGWFIL